MTNQPGTLTYTSLAGPDNFQLSQTTSHKSAYEIARLWYSDCAQQIGPARNVSLYVRMGLDGACVGSLPSVCAIGAFDGVHLGHRALIAAAIQEAKDSGSLAIAVLFNPDPAHLLAPDSAAQDLLPIDERIRVLLSLGLDAVACVSFTHSIAALSYQEFFELFLLKALCCKSIHVGRNFRMGKDGAGDIQALAPFAARFDVALTAHELECAYGETVSSTRIRNLLAAGDIDMATRLLGRTHCVGGLVKHGRGEGTSFGFPTANIHIDPQICLPKEGVYACYVGDGARLWPAAVNVGSPRSFDGTIGTPLLEATLLGFEGDLYGKNLLTSFVAWLRGPKQFATLEELESTVLSNVDWVRTHLGEGELHD